MSKLSIKGLERLDKLAQNLEDLSHKKSVSYEELFDSDFMQANTNQCTFSAFLEAGGFKVESREDFEAIPDTEFDVYIHQTTTFSNWAEMNKAAASSWIRRQIFNDL